MRNYKDSKTWAERREFIIEVQELCMDNFLNGKNITMDLSDIFDKVKGEEK